MAPAKKIVHGSRNTYERHGCRCDECRAQNARRSAAYRDENQQYINEKGRESYHRHRDRLVVEKREKHDARKNKARCQVTFAIAKGRLKRGQCEIGVDCRGEIQAHHDDYDKPLEVRWFCRRHHALLHVELAKS